MKRAQLPKATEHLSLRKFFMTTSIMITILLLFQSTQVIREYVTRYEKNDYVPSNAAAYEITWQPVEIDVGKQDFSSAASNVTTHESSSSVVFPHNKIVYVGDAQSREAQIVRQWCALTKRLLGLSESLPSLAYLEDVEAVLVSGDCVQTERDAQALSRLAQSGVCVVLCALPDVGLIEESADLRRVMGVHSVTEAAQTLTGIWLFDGFLLGGETILRAREGDKASQLRQDMDLEAPFLRLAYGTKTYMCGTLESEHTRAEYLPPLVWRHTAGNAYVFVVNGAYLSDVSGMGILEALMADKQDYSLRPIVNAQVLSIVSFPTFASENEEEMRELYGRTQYGFETEVLLPEMVAAGQRNNFSLSCFAAPQLNYADNTLPNEAYYSFFMRQLRAERAEVALNVGQAVSSLPLDKRWNSIQNFLRTIGTRYDFRAVHGDKTDLAALAEKDSVRVIVCDYDESLPVVGYLDSDTTLLTSPTNLLSVSFMDEFRLKSIETLLGYSNATLDLTPIYWPTKPSHEWMRFQEAYSSNLHTYWLPYAKLDRLTISQADGRYRLFASTDVSSKRSGNTITAHVNNRDCTLMLRTHGETIRRISGAKYTQLEEDVFLIHMTALDASIELTSSVAY